MNPKTVSSCSLLVLAAALVFVFSFSTTPVNALNILEQLKGYDDYGAFVEILNKTKLYQKINQRNTVTILALTNSTLASIQGRDDDEKEKIISTHILLDYFDQVKLSKIKSVSITNLYQSSGTANDEQGFVNITRLPSGTIVFGSAVNGSKLVAKLEKQVFTKPYNLSVLQVSLPIIAPGIGEAILPPPPPPYTPPPSASPKKSGKGGDDEEETTVEDADAPEDAPAEGPESASPAPSPGGDADAPGPSADKEEDTPADATPSSGSRVFVGAAALMALVFNML